jgi:hypothetical protein
MQKDFLIWRRNMQPGRRMPWRTPLLYHPRARTWVGYQAILLACWRVSCRLWCYQIFRKILNWFRSTLWKFACNQRWIWFLELQFGGRLSIFWTIRTFQIAAQRSIYWPWVIQLRRTNWRSLWRRILSKVYYLSFSVIWYLELLEQRQHRLMHCSCKWWRRVLCIRQLLLVSSSLRLRLHMCETSSIWVWFLLIWPTVRTRFYMQ